MNEPIWTFSTKFGLPFFILVALAAFGFAAWWIVEYFRDKAVFKNAMPRAEERMRRAETFAAEMKARVTAERTAAAGVTGVTDRDTWVSDYEIRGEYEDAFPDADYFRDLNCTVREDNPDDSRSSYFGPAAALAGAGLLVVALTAMSMYPWSAVYHQWRVVEGPVAAVSGEKLDSTDGGSLWLSWVFDINGKKYVCDEPRCGTIDPGEIAKLRCKPSYQDVGSEVNNCKFVSVKGA
jgi:hypothetical protein